MLGHQPQCNAGCTCYSLSASLQQLLPERLDGDGLGRLQSHARCSKCVFRPRSSSHGNRLRYELPGSRARRTRCRSRIIDELAEHPHHAQGQEAPAPESGSQQSLALLPLDTWGVRIGVVCSPRQARASFGHCWLPACCRSTQSGWICQHDQIMIMISRTCGNVGPSLEHALLESQAYPTTASLQGNSSPIALYWSPYHSTIARDVLEIFKRSLSRCISSTVAIC